MQISYAQNLEDYYLDLVFAGQKSGTYIDVGAGHPVADNVSFWFYLKGWRGLIVEPQERLADLYAQLRPRDHTVSCLAGRSDGEIDFHVVEKMHGFSTAVREHAASASHFGAGYRTVRKSVRSLTAILGETDLRAIDFLKIDVEGAEADVLAGLDLVRIRPRVILIEAVAPGSMAETWEIWEPDLLRQGYAHVFFDGLNRYYVADEAADALKSRFPAQPAPWGRVQHLWDFGRGPERSDHPDHVLARLLQHGLFASLPALDPKLLAGLIERGLAETGRSGYSPETAAILLGAAEFPGEKPPTADLTGLLSSDAIRAAVGRIACMYDGGHIAD
jgi:FkbM family methyltransferase